MKRILFGFLAVFVVLEVVDIIVHGVILGSVYQTLENVWRPDMMEKMWIFHLVRLIVAFFFTFIFSKGYENKGIMEGIRYGFYVGMLLSVGYAYGSYASFNIPYYLALQWFLYALVEYILAGIALALVFKAVAEKTPPAAA